MLEAEAPGFMKLQEWPASSPNLAPCDYRLWHWLNTRVYQGEDPRSKAELKQKIRSAWNELPNDVVAGWIREFLPRAVINQEGRQIQQFFNRV
ncbi:hypothetical protein L596_025611 [Steinernema carpocapsae]|uniref:Uncharacterized protein n=1 Tax=Steinernema carpocapsae TaxID=34508 RepID=A0A4U5M8A4_STECR|nr:hypothetical protein L596_025611 [Steinernema carpocapsae]